MTLSSFGKDAAVFKPCQKVTCLFYIDDEHVVI